MWTQNRCKINELMAIFSRRLLQAMLDENSNSLAPPQLQGHVDRLNGKDPEQRVSTEWEVAILNAASKLVHVEFEPPMATGRKPDMRLTLGSEEVLAEITSVSDKGLHEANPMDYLCSELHRRVRKLRLDPNKFYVRVGGNHTELWLGGDAKATLKLPHPTRFASDIFGARFREFAQSAKNLPQKAISMEISTDEVQVKFDYNPNQQFFGSTHLSYTVSHLLRNNPLFNRLKRKAEQLQNPDYIGTLGIIVCDGGCALLRDEGSRGMHYGCRDIVKEFFRCYPRIGFVQTIVVNAEFALVSQPKRLRVISKQYRNTTESLILLDALSRLHEKMPGLESTPSNAYHQHHRFTGRSFVGGWGFNGRMTISVRMLQELLAGRITSAQFLEAHEDFRPGNGANIFESKLQSGQLINGAEIISGGTKDDDWIAFEFGEPDPAASPFRMPLRMSYEKKG